MRWDRITQYSNKLFQILNGETSFSLQYIIFTWKNALYSETVHLFISAETIIITMIYYNFPGHLRVKIGVDLSSYRDHLL
jgi:hypothetical protein